VVLTVRSTWWSRWMSGRWPWSLGSAEGSSKGWIYVWVSCVCSFHSSHCVFSLAPANYFLVLVEWCFEFELCCSQVLSLAPWRCERGPWCWCSYMFFARFPVN
jgi:hypothetical protein